MDFKDFFLELRLGKWIFIILIWISFKIKFLN